MNPLLPEIFKAMDPGTIHPGVYNHNYHYGLSILDFSGHREDLLSPGSIAAERAFIHFRLYE